MPFFLFLTFILFTKHTLCICLQKEANFRKLTSLNNTRCSMNELKILLLLVVPEEYHPALWEYLVDTL